MTAPRFSVVIPAYDATSTIATTIASVLAQTLGDLELIAVDDGSRDATAERIQALAAADRRVRLIRQENQGTAGARNTGIAAARGSFVSFLDHDDLWMPHYLAGMEEGLAGAPDAGFAYTDAWVLDDRVGRIRERTTFALHPDVPRAGSANEQLLRLIRSNYIMSSTTLRAEVLREVGGFDTEIRGADDWDLWLRILARGRRAIPARGCLMISRDHPTKQSSDLVMMLRNDERVIAKLHADPDLSAEARAAALAKLSEIRRRRARLEAGGVTAVLRSLRTAQRRLGERITARQTWRARPPAEVAVAFPDLVHGWGRPGPLRE